MTFFSSNFPIFQGNCPMIVLKNKPLTLCRPNVLKGFCVTFLDKRKTPWLYKN